MRLIPALALMILFAPADAARAESALEWDGPVLEIVTFRLGSGATDRAFLDTAKATATPLQAQPGFISRTLTRSEDGLWSDHVLWSSMAAAMAGAEAMMAEPAFGPFMALIDAPTVTMRHEPVLWQMD
jgi:hypothetical protein